MKRVWKWLAGGAGGVAGYRAFRRHSPEPVPVPDGRADELRAMLADQREPAPLVEPSVEDVDSRRRAVHDQARAALDEMRGE